MGSAGLARFLQRKALLVSIQDTLPLRETFFQALLTMLARHPPYDTLKTFKGLIALYSKGQSGMVLQPGYQSFGHSCSGGPDPARV